MRLDKFLKVSRLIKRRTVANEACDAGRVLVNDKPAKASTNVKVGDIEGFMNVCLPFITLEEVMDKLNTKYWYSTMQEIDSTDYGEDIEYLISKAAVPIKAVLGRSTISVNDFVNLQKGDIIKLNAGIEEELKVYVGNIEKFKALPGAAAENYAVRITSIIREE